MVEINVLYDNKFVRFLNKIKDNSFKEQIRNLIKKIINNPEIGKPIQYKRQGTREVYAGSYRLAYAYLPPEKQVSLS